MALLSAGTVLPLVPASGIQCLYLRTIVLAKVGETLGLKLSEKSEIFWDKIVRGNTSQILPIRHALGYLAEPAVAPSPDFRRIQNLARHSDPLNCKIHCSKADHSIRDFLDQG